MELNGIQMTYFILLTLVAMLTVFGVDIRQKRREYINNL